MLTRRQKRAFDNAQQIWNALPDEWEKIYFPTLVQAVCSEKGMVIIYDTIN